MNTNQGENQKLDAVLEKEEHSFKSVFHSYRSMSVLGK
jgi:hypothetical protein